MKNKLYISFSITVYFFLLLCSPGETLAVTRGVVTNTTLCSTLTTTFCYTNVQTAVNAAVSGDSIEIRPGSYSENITLPTTSTGNFSLTIYGTETARVILSGGSGDVFSFVNTIAGTTMNISIRNITISGGSTGIRAQGYISLRVYNSVFEQLINSAVMTVSPLLADIVNNTFYNNNTAVSRDSLLPTIKNNIFSTNTVAITFSGTTGLGTNCYFSNGDDTTGPRETTAIIGSDPLFVSIAKGDFHLKLNSPCINAGDTFLGNNKVGDTTKTDIGAYGGPNSDTVPFPISDLLKTGTTASTISLSWSSNDCYLVGGYKVYYGTSPGNYTTTQDAGNVTTYDVTGLSSATTPTGEPVITGHDIASQTITLFWNADAVSGATGYEVRYDTAGIPTAGSPSKDAGNSSSYILGGLQNNTYYYINVTAYAQTTYYVAVKTYYAADPINMLSDYSNEVNSAIGSRLYSATSSSAIYDFPEPITAVPALPNTGCFIATAAYGSYSASEVQALRLFRDRYLMTNGPGRAFVRWYYTHGPRGAQFLNDHPEWKPLMRTALLPAVGIALFLTHTSAMTKMLVVLLIGLFLILLYYRKKPLLSGGVQ